jgi:hypothetical protein
MPKKLLIDGVKFHEWTPEDEVKEFHPIVKEHAREIFGKSTRFLDLAVRLRSQAGIGSEPDGIVINPVDAKLYIVEVELSKHHPYKHINDQLTRFINGLDNWETKSNVVETIFDEITSNRDLKTYFDDKVKDNLHKWLSQLLSKPPNIVVVIEEKTPDVVEACKILTKSYDTKILEFKTFTREEAPTVHAHLFDSLEEIHQEGEKSQFADLVPSSNMKDVFFVYKGKRYEGKFNVISQRLTYEGNEYSPSAAASKITNTSVNGWVAWIFKDGQGNDHRIKELQNAGEK